MTDKPYLPNQMEPRAADRAVDGDPCQYEDCDQDADYRVLLDSGYVMTCCADCSTKNRIYAKENGLLEKSVGPIQPTDTDTDLEDGYRTIMAERCGSGTVETSAFVDAVVDPEVRDAIAEVRGELPPDATEVRVDVSVVIEAEVVSTWNGDQDE